MHRSVRARAALATVLATVLGTAVAAALVPATSTAVPDGAASRAADVRTTRGLFVDPLMPAAQQGPAYASIARRSQALWLGNEYYPTDRVQGVVEAYVDRAEQAGKTPVLVVYSIPDRDCGQYSSGGLPGGAAYRAWVAEVAQGVRGSKPLLVLEPDAIPFYGDPGCENAGDRLGLLRFAVKRLSAAGAWVYLDAGHSDWRPYDGRARLLKKAGVALARGISTNVSNFRRLAAEKAYAATLRKDLAALGVTGVKQVVDTSRNGAKEPVDGDVINPTWARVGKPPRLVLDGAFDGTLWVKHPGESDGPVNGGPPSGQWCDLLADRLLGRQGSGSC